MGFDWSVTKQIKGGFAYWIFVLFLGFIVNPMNFIKFCLFILVFVCCTEANCQPYRLNKKKYSVDTGLCSIGSTVKFRLTLNLHTGYYPGCRYGTRIDYGDGAWEQRRDTGKSVPFIIVIMDCLWEHVYQSAGVKTVKIYLTDSNDVRIDSVVNTYDVGNCKKAVGLMHSQARQNCEPDFGEDVFENEFVKIHKNFQEMFIWTDSNSYYNLPVFPKDTFSSYTTCKSKYITYNRPGGNFPIANLSDDWAYFDTLKVKTDHICFEKEVAHFYFENLFSSGSQTNHEYRVKLDFGDSIKDIVWFSINRNRFWDIDRLYRKPGTYHTRFVLYNRHDQPQWHDKITIYADSCRALSMKLHYDADSNCAFDNGEATLDTTRIQLLSLRNRSYKMTSDTNGSILNYNLYKGDTVTVDTLTWYEYKSSVVNPFNKLVCGPVMTYKDSVYDIGYRHRQLYGYLYKDVNANCAYDTTEPTIANQSVIAICDDRTVAVTTTDSAGKYVLNVGNNKDYFLHVADVNIYGDSLTCGPSNIKVAKYGPDSRNDFSYSCASVKNVGVFMYNNPTKYGDTATTFVRLKYNACDTGSTNLKIILDTNVRFVSSSVMPYHVSGNTLWYYLQELDKYTRSPLSITYAINTGVKAKTICHKAELRPMFNDFDVLDNIVSVCDSVHNRVDFDKRLNVQSDTSGNVYFIYSISATNNSIIPVHTIQVVDTLDTALNVSSVVILGSTHPVLMSTNGNVVKFTFYNAKLTSLTGDSNSMACVRFRVNPKLPIQGPVKNSAGVYFDGSKAGHTNAVLYNYHPASIGLAGSFLNIRQVYPNPAKDILHISLPDEIKAELYDILGRKCPMAQYSNGMMDMSKLPSGNYILQVAGENGHREYYKVAKE